MKNNEQGAVSTAGRRRVGRWCMASAWVLAVALPGPAGAGVAGVVATTVQSLSNTVSYASVSKGGTPLVTYIGYQLTTTYGGTNTTNNVVLQGDLMVTDVAELATLTFDAESSSSACSAQTLPDRITLTCVVGQLRAGAAPIVYPVFFKAPRKVDANGVADVDGSDVVTLTGTTYYAEGSDGAGNTNNAAAWTGPEPVVLGTVVNDSIKSVLPGRGGNLFTGDEGRANALDPFATRASVPDVASAGYSHVRATLDESSSACANSPLGGGVVCLHLDLAVVDGGGNVAVFPFEAGNALRTALGVKYSIGKDLCPKSSCRLEDLRFRYEGVVVESCPVLGVPLGTGFPCLNGPPKRIKDPRNKDRDGTIEAETLSTRNGRITIGP